MSEFIIPWTKLGPSGPSQDNLLWQSGNLFVMDNHRLSLWCMSQLISPEQNYRFFHLDAHYDCDPSLINMNLPLVQSLTINDYQKFSDEKDFIFRWDNYLPLFFKQFPLMDYSVAATHHIGTPRKFDHEIPPYDLLRITDDLLLFNKNWIVNIDFDYFYGRKYKDFLLFSDDFIVEFFKLLKLNFDEGHIQIMTVALSPECCGGWEQSLKVLSLFEKVFSITIPRPEIR